MNRLFIMLHRIDIHKMYHLFVVFFMISTMVHDPWIKVPIVLVGVVNLVYRNEFIEKWSVIFYALNFIASWYISYYILANHRSLFGIFTLYMVYRLWFQDKKWNFPFYLLSFVIIVATVQKLLSPYFMEGNLVGELFMSGTSFPQLGPLVDADFGTHTNEFTSKFYDVIYDHKDHSLSITNEAALLSKVMSWLIIITEILLSLALLLLPVKKKYYAMLLFLIGTAFIRSEFGFFSILTLICCFDTRIQGDRIQQLLKILFFIFTCIFCYTKLELFFS